MASSVSPTIVNVGYRSTNFWVVTAGRNRLLVDLGWPGKAAALFANLERMGVPLSEIRYGLATHYHIDHAGAAQDDDSVSLVLDIGCAFTGDLTMESMVAGEDPAVVACGWQMLRDRG